MGLAEDLKALQELRDKGELSESAYVAARDAALARQAPSAKTPVISKPTKVFLAAVVLFLGFSFLVIIYVNATHGHGNALQGTLTVTDEVENVPAASWKALNYSFPSGGRFRGRPKKGLQTALEGEVAQEVEALLGREALAELDFEALEVALRQRTLRLAAHAIEQRLNADLSDQAHALRCPCGNAARYVARRTKNFVSVLALCDSNAPTIIAPSAATASILVINKWG